MRLLLLGGTGEARALAAALHPGPVEVISSLAGRVSNPALPLGAVRVGGFGGVDGLVAYLRDERIDAVVDATHPFAAGMSAHAAEAAERTGVPLLALRRPGWATRDSWTRVASTDAAAAAVRTHSAGTVFLTTGKRDLGAFAPDATRHYVIRVVDPPEGALPARHTVVLDRGPYSLDGELGLLRRYAVGVLVTKDSGGPLTAAKLDAAEQLDVPVVVVDRPSLPDGVESVDSVDAALAWISPRGNASA